MAHRGPGSRRTAVAVLVVARVAYAYNWYAVGAVLPLIGRSLDASTAQLGIVLGAFLVGAALFQIPAGLASVRFGARPVSLAGIGLFGAAGVASAFSTGWPELAALRFVAGAGAALFFSPALGLIASYYPGPQKGPVIGLYNGGFNLGGALGLLLGASIGVADGWPFALGYGGIALLALTLLALWLVPSGAGGTGEVRRGAPATAIVRRVLASRPIWALSVAIAGFWGAVYVVGQYFVDFAAVDHPGWGIPTAALLTALVVLVAAPAGPLGGWLAERGGDRRLLLGACTLAGSLLLFTLPYAPLPALVGILLVFGLLEGIVFAVTYVIPAYLPESEGEGLALGLSVVNSVQVLLGGALAIAFGFVAQSAGFGTAWLFAGAVGLAPLVVLLWIPQSRRAVRSEGARLNASPENSAPAEPQ
jgi:MFS transporter, ACDE family, multidrug resistance protein